MQDRFYTRINHPNITYNNRIYDLQECVYTLGIINTTYDFDEFYKTKSTHSLYILNMYLRENILTTEKILKEINKNVLETIATDYSLAKWNALV